MQTIITAVPHNSSTSSSTMDVSTLSWEQRLAIHSAYKSTIAKSSQVFGVTPEQFKQAKLDHKADTTFDVAPFASMFAKREALDADGKVIAKPRGRQTNKIADAFNAVTSERIPLAQFCEEHKVSEHVMRQRKRFAEHQTDVVCRKINGVPYIWRLSEEEKAAQQVSQVVDA